MVFHPAILWLAGGAVLCLVEAFVPSAFVLFVMGLSAITVGMIALVLPYFGVQVALWMVFSIFLIWFSRRFISPRRPLALDATVAETITEILPGKTGRVLYEGVSWQARCDDPELAIGVHEKLVVVSRQGTTLIVMPDRVIRAYDDSH